jgi:carboxyl-terminal processing protease
MVLRFLERLGRFAVLIGVFALASYFAVHFGTGGLWRGLAAAHAVASPGQPLPPYDLTQLIAVKETLNTVRAKYVDPARVKPRQMFLSALNEIQREVAQVIVRYDEKTSKVWVQVDTESRDFRVDNVQGPWDVAARLREVFTFIQQPLKDAAVDLREVENAACNGMLRTLDPHSVFLSPDAYREMRLSTSGHFGGLGIVISIRDQMLTVMRPMPGTPAGRAGLKRLDRIVKINNESTLNMPLDDAVQRLRGKPGSKVTVWLERSGTEGWQGPRPFELVREEIQVRSVEGRQLQPGIGYVRVKGFQESTAEELDEVLRDLHKKERLRGLVLDLRSNPGGLLEQAEQVADKFLDDGIIVATQGASEGRNEKRAVRAGTEPDYPIVVLVNGISASASEIVAGALKNLDRAVIVGQTTFGKGSVQLVFPRVTPDNAALKLTIAQYLTPGDYSIQGVGVAPDIELDPMTADTLEMDLVRSDHAIRERDLTKSLSGAAKRNPERPLYRLRYNLSERDRAAIRDRGDDVEDEFELDFPVKIGQGIASRLAPGKRSEQLRSLKAYLTKAQETEDQAVALDLSRLGIDWSAPPKTYGGGLSPSDYEIKVSTDRASDTVTAGDSLNLTVSVRNKGKVPIYQLHGLTKSDSAYWEEKELAIGRILPNETKSVTVPLGFCEVEGRKPGSSQPLPEDAKRICRIPRDAETRADIVRIRFTAPGTEPPNDAEFRPTITALPKPIFSYNYQVADNRPGNGDGQIATGEGVTIYLTTKNAGKGASFETQANLRNLTGDGLLLHAGRFDVSNMKPNDVKNVAFTFDALDSLAEPNATLEISVVDRDLRIVSSEKAKLPVVKTPIPLVKAGGLVATTAVAPVRGQPLAASPIVGQLAKGAVLERLATFGEFTKVGLGDARFGFVETRALRDGASGGAKVLFDPVLSHSPPLLEVAPATLATRETKVRLAGRAVDSDRVQDVFVFVGPRKVFYQSNRKSADPKKLEFSFDVELSPGVNVITVVARENEDTASRQTVVVRRDGPNGEALPTPKGEALGEAFGLGSKE